MLAHCLASFSRCARPTTQRMRLLVCFWHFGPEACVAGLGGASWSASADGTVILRHPTAPSTVLDEATARSARAGSDTNKLAAIPGQAAGPVPPRAGWPETEGCEGWLHGFVSPSLRLPVRTVAAGTTFVAALVEGGGVWVAGDSDCGALGLGPTVLRAPALTRLEAGHVDRRAPWASPELEDEPGAPEATRVALPPAAALACGSDHLALTDVLGWLWTCGSGLRGACGHGSMKATTVPRRVDSLGPLVPVRRVARPRDAAGGGATRNGQAGQRGRGGAAASDSAPACKADVHGEGRAPGRPAATQSGLAAAELLVQEPLAPHRALPRHHTVLRGSVVSAACGAAHTVVVRTDGSVAGWGCNSHGQLGLPRPTRHRAVASAADAPSAGRLARSLGGDAGGGELPRAVAAALPSIAPPSESGHSSQRPLSVAWEPEELAPGHGGAAAVRAGNRHTVVQLEGGGLLWFGQGCDARAPRGWQRRRAADGMEGEPAGHSPVWRFVAEAAMVLDRPGDLRGALASLLAPLGMRLQSVCKVECASYLTAAEVIASVG